MEIAMDPDSMEEMIERIYPFPLSPGSFTMMLYP